MLLLVMQAEFHDGQRFVRKRLRRQQIADLRIHRIAVIANFIDRGARQQAALRARILFADGVVVRVVKITKRRLKRCVIRRIPFEHERFKKPGGMRKMPLQRTRIRHRLQRAVFGGQSFNQPQCLRAHAGVVARDAGLA